MTAYDCFLTTFGACIVVIAVYFVYVAWKGFKQC